MQEPGANGGAAAESMVGLWGGHHALGLTGDTVRDGSGFLDSG